MPLPAFLGFRTPQQRPSGKRHKGPLRIAHILESFAVGGAERLALDIAKAQARLDPREKAHVWAVSLGPAGEQLEPEFKSAGVNTVTMQKRVGVDLTLVPRLVAWFLMNRIDIVHTHNPASRIYAGPAARIAGAYLVNTLHGKAPEIWRRMLLRRVATQLVDAFVVVSPRLTEFAKEEEAAEPGKIVVIENGVDVNRFRPTLERRSRTRAKLGAQEGAFVIGTAARLSPEKDQATLLRATAPLIQEGARVVIAGDGPERTRLETLARTLGIERGVTFLGMVPDVAELLPGLDVFVLSSRREGLPLSILEAMATGIPIVATSVGGIPNALHDGHSGVLVKPGDAGAIRAGLERLRDHPSEAGVLGIRARERVMERFSSRKMQDAYSKLYSRLIATSGDSEALT